MRALFFCGLLWLAAGALHAQQRICERGIGNYPATSTPYSAAFMRGQLTATAPDSCLLYLASPPAGSLSSVQSRTSLVWVGRTQCDTVSFARLAISKPSSSPVAILPRRPNELWVLGSSVGQTSSDSTRLVLRSYSRRGILRWARTYPAPTLPYIPSDEYAQALIAAPDHGAYLVSRGGSTRLTKVDSLGRRQWQRSYDPVTTRIFEYARPAYTVRGNLLLAGRLNNNTGDRGLVMEVNQRGDSITSRTILYYPNRPSQLTGVRRLHDGGFFLVGQLDTALAVNHIMPVFVRLDANLNILWTYTHRSLRTAGFTDLSRGGLELADGSLLAVIASSKTTPIHFLRLSVAGALLNDYTYQSNYPAFDFNESLTPLAADSSFVLASAPANVYSTYIDHFRIPGLRRVLPEPPPPPAQVLAARAPAAGVSLLAAYPNPATTTLYVPYTLPAGLAEAELRAYDALGRLTMRQTVQARQGVAELAVRNWAPGLYNLVLSSGNQILGSQRVSVTSQL